MAKTRRSVTNALFLFYGSSVKKDSVKNEEENKFRLNWKTSWLSPALEMTHTRAYRAKSDTTSTTWPDETTQEQKWRKGLISMEWRDKSSVLQRNSHAITSACVTSSGPCGGWTTFSSMSTCAKLVAPHRVSGAICHRLRSVYAWWTCLKEFLLDCTP